MSSALASAMQNTRMTDVVVDDTTIAFIGLGNFSHLAAFQALNLTVMLPYFVLYANSLYATFAGLALFFMLRFTQHCMFIALRCNPFRDPLRVQPAADAARDFKMAGAAI